MRCAAALRANRRKQQLCLQEPMKKCHLIPALRSDKQGLFIEQRRTSVQSSTEKPAVRKSNVLRAEVAGRVEARVGWEERLDSQP